MSDRIHTVVGRIAYAVRYCDGCESLMRDGDIYVNTGLIVSGAEDVATLCRQCVLDLDNAVNDFMRREDHGSTRPD